MDAVAFPPLHIAVEIREVVRFLTRNTLLS